MTEQSTPPEATKDLPEITSQQQDNPERGMLRKWVDKSRERLWTIREKIRGKKPREALHDLTQIDQQDTSVQTLQEEDATRDEVTQQPAEFLETPDSIRSSEQGFIELSPTELTDREKVIAEANIREASMTDSEVYAYGITRGGKKFGEIRERNTSLAFTLADLNGVYSEFIRLNKKIGEGSASEAEREQMDLLNNRLLRLRASVHEMTCEDTYKDKLVFSKEEWEDNLVKAEGEDNEVRRQLHQEVPGYAIIRFPSEQQASEIPINYWKKQIALRRYVDRSLFRGSSDRQEEGSEDYFPREKILDDDEVFTKWILACHRKGCVGDDGELYTGKSDVGFAEEHVGKLRQPGSRIVTYVEPEKTDHLYLLAKEVSFATLNQEPILSIFRESSFAAPARVEGIENPDYVPPRASHDLRADKDRYSNYPQFATGIIFKNGFEFPKAEAIPDYLRVMKGELKQLIEKTSTPDAFTNEDEKDMFISDRIANFYRPAIISQAVESVWNSVSMGVVNNMLDHYGYQQLEHGILDYEAFYLSPEGFRKHFATLLRKKS